MFINVGEIDNFLSTLNTAIKEHYLWSEKFLCLNLFGGEPDYDIIHSNSHLYCHFSEWLMLRTQGYTLERDMVLAINHHHQGMHDIARSLAEAVISGTATRSLVSQYHEQQQAFIDSIETYKSYLFAYRNQHDTLTGLPLRQLYTRNFLASLGAARGTIAHHIYLSWILIGLNPSMITWDIMPAIMCCNR